MRGEEEVWRQGHAEASRGDPPVVKSMHFRGDTFGLGEKERKESGAEGNSKENINPISALGGARIPGKKKRGKEWGSEGDGGQQSSTDVERGQRAEKGSKERTAETALTDEN